jgi:anti-sigma B factor antagonist
MSLDSSHYRTSQTDGVTIITILDPELLCDEREKLYALADSLGSDTESKAVVLNLENVRAFKSIMLGVMINFQKRLKDQGKALKLCCVDPDVLRVFKLTKMDQIFDIQPNEQVAVASTQGKSGGTWFSKVLGAFGKSHD